MGYASQTQSEQQHLREKLELSVLKTISPLVGGGGPNAPLAEAFVSRPEKGINVLLRKVQVVDGISVDSTDAELDSAVLSSSSVAVLKQIYGVV